MANRTFIRRFDSQDWKTSGLGATLPSGVTFDASVSVSYANARSLKIIAPSGSGTASVTISALGSDFRRYRIKVTAVPATTARVLIGSSALANIRLNTAGKLDWYSSNTLITSGVTAINDGNWHDVEVRADAAAGSQVRVRIDGVDEIANSNNLAIGNTFGPTDTAADTYTVFLDSIVADSTTFVGVGTVYCACPISDNARAAKWVAGSNATTATTNLFEGVNNWPPVGTATSNAVTAAISHTGGGAGNEDYDANMTTYATLGITASATIYALQAVMAHGEDASTGTKNLSFSVKSNPAQGAFETAFTAGGDAGACGTYPTNWTVTSGTIINSPSVTLANSPVMSARRTGTESRIADVCFMGVYVDAYVPPDVVEQPLPVIVPSQAVMRAAYY